MHFDEKDLLNQLLSVESKVSESYGQEVVDSTIEKYDASSLYDLQSCYLCDTLADLEMIANDI